MGLYDTESDADADALIGFIVSHGRTLKDLNVGYGPYSSTSDGFCSSRFLQADSLPRLKYYKGNSFLLEQMMRKKLTCLETSLERAVIWSDGPRELFSTKESFLNSVFQPDHPPLTLASLQELEFDM